MLYFRFISVLSSSDSDFMYDLHPGQKRVWNFHSLPRMDLGLASYFARKPQFGQFDSISITSC